PKMTPAKLPQLTVALLTFGAVFALFVFGFSDSLKGPVLPELLDDLQINYAVGGTILLGLYAGFTIASLLSGLLADRFGQKMVLVLAGATLSLGVFMFAGANTAVTLTAAMFVLGFGLGAIELGANGLIVSLHSQHQGRYLNLMAAMHGLGSTLAPLYAGLLLANDQTWRTVYRGDLLLAVPIILLFALLRFPRRATAAANETFQWRELGQSAFTPPLLLSYLTVLLYVSTEIGIASWLVAYLQDVRGQNVAQSTQALSLFWGLMMIGRFVGSFVVDRIGYLRAILIAVLLASGCLVIGLFGPSQAWWLLPLSGIFLSIVFPTFTAATASSLTENKNSILGVLFTFAGLGGIFGPWLVGVVSNSLGLSIGFSLILGLSLTTAVIVTILLRLQTSQTKEQI
ncbi:MAG: MFS transporter, partial [Candidatus Promineifilaceae bacterium]